MRQTAAQKRAAALTTSKIAEAKNDVNFRNEVRRMNARRAAGQALTASGAISAYLMAR